MISCRKYNEVHYFNELQNRVLGLYVRINTISTYDRCISRDICAELGDIELFTDKQRKIKINYNHKARIDDELTFSLSGYRHISHKSLIRVLSSLLVKDQKPDTRITINDAQVMLSTAMSALLLLNSGDELSARILWDKDQEGGRK